VLQLGDLATDIEEQSEVVVVRIIPDRCDSVVVKNGQYGEQTVYDFNSRYSYVEPDDSVLVAVYSETLPADPTEVSREGRHLLAKNSDAKQYKFPITRLEPKGSD
jgi:hypothetical protein